MQRSNKTLAAVGLVDFVSFGAPFDAKLTALMSFLSYLAQMVENN